MLHMRNSTGSARYSWAETERTRLLLSLVGAALASKRNGSRYVSSRDWEEILVAFNRRAPEPVDNLKILHNRIAVLRAQCKEYHEIVVAAAARGLSPHELDEGAWAALVARHPALGKWRRQPFEFYDEMAAWLGLRTAGHGEENERDEDEDAHAADADADAPEDGHERQGETRSGGGSRNGDGDGNDTHARPSASLPRAATTTRPAMALSMMRKRGGTGAFPPHHRPSRRKSSHQHHTARAARTTITNAATGTASASPLVSEPVTTRATTDADVSTSAYPRALNCLAALGLDLDDRIDAKRFLVDERNARVFVHMDPIEQRAYLDKYCFGQRDDQRRYHFDKVPPPSSGISSSSRPSSPSTAATTTTA